MLRSRVKALMVLSTAFLAVQAPRALSQTQNARPTAQSGNEGQTYVLGASDVVEVSVLGHPDFTTRGRINEDGSIPLPFLGTVAVGGRTVDKAGDEIGRLLERGGYFSHAIVKVEVVSYASRYVTVLGNVGTPGLIPVDRAYRLSEIIARVGGVKDSGADYVLLRPQAGGERRLSLRDVSTGGGDVDPYVRPGDKIYVPDAQLFYLNGQVTTPGAFPLRDDMTISQAIARGGGVNSQGSMKKVTVMRNGVKMNNVNLNDKVQPKDIITVGERLF
jgi:polysaccharide export outer membrane protein